MGEFYDFATVETLVASKSEADDVRSNATKICLGIIHHPDPKRIGEIAPLDFDRRGSSSLSRLAPGFGAGAKSDKKPLLDPHISRTPIRIEQVDEKAFRITPAGKSNQTQINGKLLIEPAIFNMAELGDEIIIGLAGTVILSLFRKSAVKTETHCKDGLVGISHAVSTVRSKIGMVAPTDVPVLILGETGTGKELIAQAIHRRSNRADQRLVTVNMAAISPSLGTAELFGVRRGAYTGASADKPGVFEQANLGTLFLDEVGATPAQVQPMLLRVLEDSNIKRLGDTKTQMVNVRIVAATDQLDIVNAEKSSFNQPLFRRLDGFSIEVPPLRLRRVDIGLLVDHFMQKNSEGRPVSPRNGLSFDFLMSLSLHSWPGNVRELRNAVHKHCLGGTAIPLKNATDSEAALIEHGRTQLSHERGKNKYRNPAEITEEMMFEALNESGWLIKHAALSLNVSRTSMYELMRRYRAKRDLNKISDGEILKVLENIDGGIGKWAAHLRVGHHELRKRISKLNLNANEAQSEPRQGRNLRSDAND